VGGRKRERERRDGESTMRSEWNEKKDRAQRAAECDEEDECVSIRAMSCPRNPPTPIYVKTAPETAPALSATTLTLLVNRDPPSLFLLSQLGYTV